MGNDIIFDPDFDLAGDDLEDDDPFEEFICELEAFLDVEIDEETADMIAKSIVFYFV